MLGRAPKREPVELELEAVLGWFEIWAATYEQSEVELDLVRARLADAMRDAELEPLAPDRFEEFTADFDPDAARRLAVVTSTFDSEVLRAPLGQLARTSGVEPVLRDGFIGFARARRLLTLDLVRTAPSRLEEFGRAWIHALGARVRGEAPADSAAHLFRLDYARLMAEVERARAAGEDHKAALERLREQQEQLGRRGKW
jgi:hypothetical protein